MPVPAFNNAFDCQNREQRRRRERTERVLIGHLNTTSRTVNGAREGDWRELPNFFPASLTFCL